MNFKSIKYLPPIIHQDDPQGGVLRPWVRKLPLRHQGVILTAIRGCDSTSKEDISKPLTRMIRRASLNPFDSGESLKLKGFFGFDAQTIDHDLSEFLHSLDHYPLHFITHTMLTCEVIGYKSPEYNGAMAKFFMDVYFVYCRLLHVHHETEAQMDFRLMEDKVKKGTAERDDLKAFLYNEASNEAPKEATWLP